MRVLEVLQENDKIVSASYDTTIKIWKYSTRTCERTLSGHQGPVLALVVCEGCDNLIASGGEDSTIRIWDWKEGTCIVNVSTMKNEVWSMCSFN